MDLPKVCEDAMTQHTRALTTGQVSALLRNVLHGDQTATEVLNMVATAYRALAERVAELEGELEEVLQKHWAEGVLEQKLADAQARLHRADTFLVSCPWLCGYKSDGSSVERDFFHVIDCGTRTMVSEQQHATLEAKMKVMGESHASMLKAFTEMRKAVGGHDDDMDTAIQRAATLRERCQVMQDALQAIQEYDNGNGCCCYGCDTPTIAKQALATGAEGG